MIMKTKQANEQITELSWKGEKCVNHSGTNTLFN